MTPFERRVLTIVSRIPVGRVTTYGDVARLAGRPGAARAVGNIMRRGDRPGLPYHRVIAAGGGARRLFEPAAEALAAGGGGPDRHAAPGRRIRQDPLARLRSRSELRRGRAEAAGKVAAKAEKANKYEPFRGLARLS